jgi:hypothetical protein
VHARKLRLSGLLEAALIAALASATSPARAEQPVCPNDSGDAEEMERVGRRLFEEALKREENDPRGAIEILSCIQRFADKPAVSLRVGIIAEKIGNKRLAADSYERYLALAGDAAPDRSEMQERIKKLRADEPAAKPPPATAPAPVTPQPTTPPADKGSTPTLGFIVAGVGGALLVGGGLLLYSAKKRNDDVHGLDPGKTYWNSADAKDELDTAKREQTIGFIALGLGAAATAAGIWLIVDAHGQVAATASVTPHQAGGAVRLRF